MITPGEHVVADLKRGAAPSAPAPVQFANKCSARDRPLEFLIFLIPQNLDSLSKDFHPLKIKLRSFLSLETSPGESRRESGAERALAGAERRPKKSPAGEKKSPARARSARPQALCGTPRDWSRGSRTISTLFSGGGHQKDLKKDLNFIFRF